MSAVRKLVSTLDKLAHAAHLRLPAGGARRRGRSRAAGGILAARGRRSPAAPPAEPPGPAREDAYTRAGTELPLEEALRDPIVQLVMRRDGLEPSDVRSTIAAARRRLSAPTA